MRLQAADSLYIFSDLHFFMHILPPKDLPNIFGIKLKIVKYF